MTKSKLTIASQFNGPPTFGQGGYVSGSVAKVFAPDKTVMVSLRLPTPLDKTLSLIAGDGHMDLMDDDKLLVRASTVPDLDHLTPPPCPDTKTVKKAEANYRGHWDEALFGSCFVCGVDRHDEDGLHVFTGSTDSTRKDQPGLVASHFSARARHCDDEGSLKPVFVWSVLDCAGYFSTIKTGEVALLAQFTCQIVGTLKQGELGTIIGWPIHTNGRKHLVGTALYSSDGELVAKTEGLWVAVDEMPF